MTAMLRRHAALALATVLTLAGCSPGAKGPATPEVTPLPPELVAVSPLPGAHFVQNVRPNIWAEFAQPLDSASVSVLNVYLKIDTRRTPITVAWDAATRRILITPSTALLTPQTYTVELSPNLRSADGTLLGRKITWQFTTSSVRFTAQPVPPHGAIDESPNIALYWEDPVVPILNHRYDLYFGTDSADVVNHVMSPIAIAGTNSWRPQLPWPEGTTIWWTFRALNTTTGERADGPVWRFRTATLSELTLDSLVLNASQADFVRFTTRLERLCSGFQLITGLPFSSSNLCALAWDLRNVPLTKRIAHARIELTAQSGWEGRMTAFIALQPTTAPWQCSQMAGGGPPFPDNVTGVVSRAAVIPPNKMFFEEPRLQVHVQAMARQSTGFLGYILSSPSEMHYDGTTTFTPPRLVLYLYTPPPPEP